MAKGPAVSQPEQRATEEDGWGRQLAPVFPPVGVGSQEAARPVEGEPGRLLVMPSGRRGPRVAARGHRRARVATRLRQGPRVATRWHRGEIL